VTFARDLDVVGVPQYCAWSSWAGHHKSKLVGRPERIPGGSVPKFLRDRAEEIAREKLAGDKVVHEDKTGASQERAKIEARKANQTAKLIDAGYSVGNAEDFLELSDKEIETISEIMDDGKELGIYTHGSYDPT
jgi:hypothetical protein